AAWATAPTRDVVRMAFAPMLASAAASSPRRQSKGSGTAIMPARRMPRKAMMLSTVLGNCTATRESVGSNLYKLAPRDEIARSAAPYVRLRAGPSEKLSRLGGSTSASASGSRTPARRKRSSSVARTPIVVCASPRIIAKDSWLDIRLPPGFRQVAEERSSRRSRNTRPPRDPLRRRKIKRHDIKSGQEHAIQRARSRYKIGAIGGSKHRSDHGIDRL